MSRPLHCASYLASSWFGFYEAIAQFLQRVLETDTDIVQRPCDPLDDSLLLNDTFDIILLCELPFIRHCQQYPTQLQPIAAPVIQAVHYGDRPSIFPM